eukprot:1753531-Rhodomonas_salina.1
MRRMSGWAGVFLQAAHWGDAGLQRSHRRRHQVASCSLFLSFSCPLCLSRYGAPVRDVCGAESGGELVKDDAYGAARYHPTPARYHPTHICYHATRVPLSP